jgi:hypothetical protein
MSIWYVWGKFSADELIDQEGNRTPDAGQGADGHDGAETDFSGGGLSGFSCPGDSFFSGGGMSVHGVSPYVVCALSGNVFLQGSFVSLLPCVMHKGCQKTFWIDFFSEKIVAADAGKLHFLANYLCNC